MYVLSASPSPTRIGVSARPPSRISPPRSATIDSRRGVEPHLFSEPCRRRRATYPDDHVVGNSPARTTSSLPPEPQDRLRGEGRRHRRDRRHQASSFGDVRHRRRRDGRYGVVGPPVEKATRLLLVLAAPLLEEEWDVRRAALVPDAPNPCPGAGFPFPADVARGVTCRSQVLRRGTSLRQSPGRRDQLAGSRGERVFPTVAMLTARRTQELSRSRWLRRCVCPVCVAPPVCRGTSRPPRAGSRREACRP